MAHLAQEALHYDELQYVNNLNPSAELRPLENTQTDEDDLMPYDVMQQIEFWGIKVRLSPREVFHQLTQEANITEKVRMAGYVIKFYRLWSRNQWKRERLAPGFISMILVSIPVAGVVFLFYRAALKMNSSHSFSL